MQEKKMEARDIIVNFERLVNYSKIHTVEETAEEITNIFSEDELIMKKRDIDQAYFELHSRKYLIKGGNGLNIRVISGDGDRYGKRKTHEGISLLISSSIIKDRTSYALFLEDQYEDHSIEILSLVNESIETTLTVQQTLDYFKDWNADPMLFNILSDELKNNNEIKMQVLNLIDENANSEHRDQRDYENISPHGGLDIIVSPASEIYLNMIDKFDIPGNEDFMEKAKIYFMSNTANCKFIDEELKRFDKIIYYAEHADDYRYNESILQQIEWMNFEMDMLPDRDQLLTDLEDIKIRLGVNYDLRKMNEKRSNELNSNLDELKGKTYNFLGYFTQRLGDSKKIADISKNLESLKKSDQELLNEFEDMQGTKVLIEMDIESIGKTEQKKEELEGSLVQLKYPYKYLLKDLFAEIAHDPELFENSLQRQIDAKESIIAKRNEYSELLNFTNRTPELYNKKDVSINKLKKEAQIKLKEIKSKQKTDKVKEKHIEFQK